MTATDRLDEIEARASSVADHGMWAGASTGHLLRQDIPALTAALRAVLDIAARVEAGEFPHPEDPWREFDAAITDALDAR